MQYYPEVLNIRKGKIVGMITKVDLFKPHYLWQFINTTQLGVLRDALFFGKNTQQFEIDYTFKRFSYFVLLSKIMIINLEILFLFKFSERDFI